MDLFQKDLKEIRNQIINSKEQQATLQDEKSDKELELTKLNLDNYEIEKTLSELMLSKKKVKGIEKKRKKIKIKFTLTSFLIVLLEMLFLAFTSVLSSSIMAISVFASMCAFVTLFNATNKKLNNLYLKEQKVTNNLDTEEIINNIKSLFLKKDQNCKNVSKIKEELKSINFDLKKVEDEIQMLFNKYQIESEIYQSALLKINNDSNEEKLEEVINQEYNESMPVMLKKIYSKND